jgi:hypothetical protein
MDYQQELVIKNFFSNQEFLLRTIVGGLILIIVGGAAKMFWSFPASS